MAPTCRLDASRRCGRRASIITLGTDGNNNSNYHDLMRATYLLAGLFKDARRDPTLFVAEQAYTCVTMNAARALRLEDSIGSLEPGKKADFVAHDTWRPNGGRSSTS